jgi:small conductance mechanosensitive channel
VGVNVATLIAGFGIVGIAVGLGAQAFVKDIINGIFILTEDQYRVGDVVTVAGVTGEVVDINPRRTVVRDETGAVHSIPNGAIAVATNQTQGFSRINLDVPVTYDTEIGRATDLIRRVYEETAKERPEDFLGPPKLVRLNALLENYALIRVNGDVRVGTQWELTGELRRRLKERFESEGITMTPAARWTPRPEY